MLTGTIVWQYRLCAEVTGGLVASPLALQCHTPAPEATLSEGHRMPRGGGSHGLERMQHTPVAPILEHIMRQAYQTPFATDVVQARSKKRGTTPFFALAKPPVPR